MFIKAVNIYFFINKVKLIKHIHSKLAFLLNLEDKMSLSKMYSTFTNQVLNQITLGFAQCALQLETAYLMIMMAVCCHGNFRLAAATLDWLPATLDWLPATLDWLPATTCMQTESYSIFETNIRGLNPLGTPSDRRFFFHRRVSVDTK